MQYNYYEIILLFFAYSFLGWSGETVAASLIGRRFRNRGFATIPFCPMYGLMGVAVTIAFKDLRQSVVLLFVGATGLAMMVQWISGLFLEHLSRGKWWDYSRIPLNINGYVALPVSAAFGGLGMLAVLFVNDLLLGLFRLLPNAVRNGIVWGLLAVSALDLLLSLLSFLHIGRKEKLKDWNEQLLLASESLGDKVSHLVVHRIWRAYPRLLDGQAEGQKEKLSRRALFWMFFIGALVGDGVETVFMWLTRGRWMSRSSLVWGTFSCVWGLGIAIATWILYKDRKRSDTYMFLVGTMIGATFEYFCSIFTELFFGAVFWDYSHIPFNIGGRVNLLYSFFWGIAAVVWMKHLLPLVERLLEVFFRQERYLITAFALLFMIADVLVSSAALIRYDARSEGKVPRNGIETYIDNIYTDEVMQKKYPGEKRR